MAQWRRGAGAQGMLAQPRGWILIAVAVAMCCAAAPLRLCAQAPDTVSLHFVEADLRAVVQGIGRYLDKPLLSVGVPGNRVTFETPAGFARASLPALLRTLAEQQGLELTEDSISWKLRPRPGEQVTSLGQMPGRGEGAPQLFVIRLSHAKAPDIAASVNQLFGGSGEFSGRQGIGRSGLNEQLRAAAAAAPPPAGAPPTGARGASLAGQVTIVPDEVTNSLLIRADQADFEVIQNAVRQLDIRPLQVLIEVLIVEARKDRGFSLGADVTVPQQSIGDGTAGGATKGGGLGDAVIRLMDLGRGDIDAIIRTAQNSGAVEILSRPVLIAANNTEATFMVGSQRAFPSLRRSHPTDGGVVDQEFVYRDVGTRLTILPTISHDGYVALEILQEINQATNEVQLEAPVISTREAHTQVLVRDGQTIVLGGLRDRTRDSSRRGIPILSQIPILGGLFGGVSRSSSETELFLFVTPRVLRTDADVEQATTARMPARAAEQP
jgi:type II secretory pathway component GspD/PulD (secretin)